MRPFLGSCGSTKCFGESVAGGEAWVSKDLSRKIPGVPADLNAKDLTGWILSPAHPEWRDAKAKTV